MKIFTKNSFVRKIVLALVIVVFITAGIPNRSYAANWGDVGGALLKEIIQLVASLGDVAMGTLNNMMLGTDGVGSAMLHQNDTNMQEGSGSWLITEPEEAEVTEVHIEKDYMDEKGLGDVGEYQIPNMLYCPENIFANKIAALDINFLNPNEYTSVLTGEVVQYDENASNPDKQVSGAAVLRSSIATWYKSFRNIAIVGLLSVLVYLGIRILISTTANDKAKYKENLKDWLVALCLVFVMHFIMSGIIMITDKFTELFATSTSSIKVVVDGGPTFYTNLTGLVRFKAQAQAWQEAVSYTIIYLALVIYTCIFTFIYFKRFLYTAFFTMISPLVALTYPIDKAGDKKAQAFNLWFKEYTMNVIIQPVHLLLFTALVTTAMDLVTNNPLYALVAIAFLVPAEKFIKKMFGIEAETTSGFGSFAGGALAMSALQKLGGGKKKGDSKGGNKGGDGEQKDKIRTQDNGETGKLDTFKDDEQDRLQQANSNDEEMNEQQKMLDAYDDNYGTEDWDAEERDAYAREAYKDDEGQTYSDEEYANILRDSGYSEEEIASMMGEGNDNQQENIESNTNSENIQVDESPSRMDKAKRVIKGVAPKAGRILLRAAKGTAKAAVKTTATVAGAAIGLAAGLTTGDMSKAITYTAGGAVAGNAIGDNVIRTTGTVANKAGELKDKAKDTITERTKGYDAMRKQQIDRNNARAREATLNDKNEIKKYKAMAGQIGYTGNIKDLMNAAIDYKEAGVQDEKLIKNALKVEHKNGGIGGEKHKNVVDVASFTKDYGRDYIEDSKKRGALEGVVQSKISNKDKQREIMETFADLHGRKDYYKKNSGIK